jgi:hypothetical protein
MAKEVLGRKRFKVHTQDQTNRSRRNDMALKKLSHVVSFPQSVPSASHSKKTKRRLEEAEHLRKTKRRTVFDRLMRQVDLEYDGEEPASTRMAILSASYLLDWTSDIGNRSVQGMVAAGLSRVLRQCAQDLQLVRAAAIREGSDDAAVRE